MNYYVYYNDGYADDGDVGIRVFPTEAEALEFISGRCDAKTEFDPDNYKLIKGFGMPLEVHSYAKVIRVKK